MHAQVKVRRACIVWFRATERQSRCIALLARAAPAAMLAVEFTGPIQIVIAEVRHRLFRTWQVTKLFVWFTSPA